LLFTTRRHAGLAKGDSHDVALRLRDVIRPFDPDIIAIPKTLRQRMDENAEQVIFLCA
jgi:hypothetical protein